MAQLEGRTVREVENSGRELKHTWKPKQRVRLGSHTDADESIVRLIEDLGLPVVDLVLFRNRKVAHDSALRVEELNFSASFDKAIRYLQLRLKLPCRHALFLDSKVLRKGNIGLDRLWRIGGNEGCCANARVH